MNGNVIVAIIGIVVLSLAWVVALDWCVVGIIRAWHRGKVTRRRMDEVLGSVKDSDRRP